MQGCRQKGLPAPQEGYSDQLPLSKGTALPSALTCEANCSTDKEHYLEGKPLVAFP